jgi:hypothetical protein
VSVRPLSPAVRDRDWALVAGAVDYYVHGSPDPIPRHRNDIDLAVELRSAGLAAAVHRHHSSSTVERAALAREVTGFPLWGAVEFSGPAGGLDPTLAEVGLRQGAVLVVLPMLSGSGWRAMRAATDPAERDPFDYGDAPVVGGDGRLLPAVGDVIDLVASAGAALVTGYLLPAEQAAVIRLAAARGLERIVLSNPIGRGFAIDAATVLDLAALGPVNVEISVHQVDAHLDEAAALIGRLGPERVIVSSDGGTATAPPPPELLAWGCGRLRDAGFTETEIGRMVRDNPAAMLPSGQGA